MTKLPGSWPRSKMNPETTGELSTPAPGNWNPKTDKHLHFCSESLDTKFSVSSYDMPRHERELHRPDGHHRSLGHPEPAPGLRPENEQAGEQLVFR